MIPPSIVRPRVVIVAGVALALGMSACGTSDHHAMNTNATTRVAASADHNDADVTFATGMIPHHAGALEMAKLAGTNAASPDVKTLANQIEAAQQPEIDKMNQWLQSWGQPTVDVHNAMDHMGHGGSAIPGMMSAGDMRKLEMARGTDFDKLFLQLMIEHHRGAISMAQTELRDGKSAETKAMAQSIATSQQAEVVRMDSLLKQVK